MPASRASCAALVLACVAGGTWAGTAIAAPPQELALLRGPSTARAAPDPRSAVVERVGATRPITGERTTLPVIGHAAGWLRVLLPGRPNGHSGWIRASGATAAATDWRVVVRTRTRAVLVYRGDLVVRRFAAVVGKPATPTPAGRFFVEESVALRAADAGAPYALALSARSSVLQEFDGGPGQIALHGLRNVGGTPGTAVSHGCVRLDDAAIVWLARRIGPGVPVTILDR